VPAHHILALRPGEQRVVAGILPLHMLHGQLNGIAGGRDAKAVRVLDGNIASGPKNHKRIRVSLKVSIQNSLSLEKGVKSLLK